MPILDGGHPISPGRLAGLLEDGREVGFQVLNRALHSGGADRFQRVKPVDHQLARAVVIQPRSGRVVEGLAFLIHRQRSRFHLRHQAVKLCAQSLDEHGLDGAGKPQLGEPASDRRDVRRGVWLGRHGPRYDRRNMNAPLGLTRPNRRNAPSFGPVPMRASIRVPRGNHRLRARGQ